VKVSRAQESYGVQGVKRNTAAARADLSDGIAEPSGRALTRPGTVSERGVNGRGRRTPGRLPMTAVSALAGWFDRLGMPSSSVSTRDPASRGDVEEAWPRSGAATRRHWNSKLTLRRVSQQRKALHRWLKRCEVRDTHGQPVHHTPHHAFARLQHCSLPFAGIVTCQVGTAFAARTDRVSLRSISFTSNRLLLGAICVALALAASLSFLPFLHSIFGTATPTAGQLVIVAPHPFVVWGADEICRWVQDRRHAYHPKE